MNNVLQKAIPRFFIGSFFIALLCTVIISEFVGEAFFLSFLISFVPGVMTYLFCYSEKSKSLLWAVFIGGIFYAFFNPYYRRIIFAFC